MLKKGVWTQEEITYLQLHYADEKTEDVAKALNCTTKRIFHKANKLGLKKSSLFWRNVYNENYSEATKKGQFQKGLVPHNKGVKMSEELRQKIAYTWFKKGNESHNKQPIGTIKMRGRSKRHRFLYIKVSENQWQLYGRYVWEQKNGKIPSGHIVSFKDGNIHNCDIENLALISRAENLNRNSFHRFTNELKSLIYLNRTIKKRIRQIIKKRNIKL